MLILCVNGGPTLVSVRKFGQRVVRWCSTTKWGAAPWQQGLAAGVAAIIFWPQASVDAGVGLDPSWQAGLALARINNLAWGPEIVFTYGPLGFLQNTPYYSFDQSLLATIYQPIVVAALFLGIAAALRQRQPPMPSLIGAFIATGIIAILLIGRGLAPGIMYPELAVLAAFAWGAVPLLQHDPRRSTVFTTCVVLGAVAGIQLLVKLNSGLAIVGIALAVSILLDWRAVGRHCITVSAFAGSTLISWMLAGQRPADLLAWLKSSAALVSGYSDAMATALIPLGPEAVVGIVLTVAWIATLCVMFVRGRPEIPRNLVLLAALVTLISAKRTFVRLDLAAVFMLLAPIVLAVAVTPLSRARRRGFVVVGAAIICVLLSVEALVVHILGYPQRAVVALQGPVQTVDRLLTLSLPGHVDQRVEHAKARQRALYAVPERFVNAIGSGTVHVDPAETSAVWAYGLPWRPAPVFQTYAAFTPSLDRLNSESLAKAPQFVLSRLSPESPAIGGTHIEGRLGVQESPLYSRALLCNYTVSGVENRWALFANTGPRCGPLTELSQVVVRENDVIAVPAPSGSDMAVLVGIDLEPTVVDRLFQGTVAPLIAFTVVIDGVTYRLTAANAAEPFLVNTPASVDGTRLQIHAHTIGVGRTQSLGQGNVSARLRFYEMPVEP